jgi:nickel/cobalt transporter (NicO) family protein
VRTGTAPAGEEPGCQCRVTVAGVLVVFACVTMATFIGLTILTTIAGYQVKGEWLEHHATSITALVLLGIGIVAYIGF